MLRQRKLQLDAHTVLFHLISDSDSIFFSFISEWTTEALNIEAGEHADYYYYFAHG